MRESSMNRGRIESKLRVNSVKIVGESIINLC